LSNNIKISSYNEIYEEILSAMKTGNPESVRKLLKSNTVDYTSLYKFLYEKLMVTDEDVFKNDAGAILLIGEHSYRDAIVSIKEINFMHMYFDMLSNGVV
jgi:hypothetical protein